MTRLVILILAILTAAVVGTVCYYVIRRPAPDAAVVGAMAGVVGALVLNGIVAIVKRGNGE